MVNGSVKYVFKEAEWFVYLVNDKSTNFRESRFVSAFENVF